MGEENKPPEWPGADARQGGRKDRRPRQRWNQGNNSGKFRGKTKEIEYDTFNNTGPQDAAQFNKSLKNIPDYLQLNHGNDVSEAVRNMSPVIIAIPPVPVGKSDPKDTSGTTLLPVAEVDLYLWKCEHNKAQDRKDKYDENMAKAYIIAYHQCSPTLKNDLKASDAFATISSSQDVIALLKLIQSLCCSFDVKTQGSWLLSPPTSGSSPTIRKMAWTITPTTGNSSPMSKLLKPMGVSE
jgi:hypothetical protein